MGAAIVNTLSPGDTVCVMVGETGHFDTLWRQMAAAGRIRVDFICTATGGRAVDPAEIEDNSHRKRRTP